MGIEGNILTESNFWAKPRTGYLEAKTSVKIKKSILMSVF